MSGILFLCTGNSCRSQMAEGFGKAIYGDERPIFSAGTKPQGIHPVAIEVMKEVDISIESHQSTHPRWRQNQLTDPTPFDGTEG